MNFKAQMQNVLLYTSSVMLQILLHTSKYKSWWQFHEKKITLTQNISITDNETVIQAVNNQSA